MRCASTWSTGSPDSVAVDARNRRSGTLTCDGRSVNRVARARRPGRASNLCWVTFRPASIQGAVREAGGAIDYRLARHALVSEFKKGRLAEHEVCDAHPELVRAARELGDPTSMTCPICEETQVVLVSYVFGPRLPAHGRCVSQKGELAKLAKRKGDLTCYVVEVCPNCSWNHLARTFPL